MAPDELPVSVWLVEDDDLYREGLDLFFRPPARFRCVRSFADAESVLAALERPVELPRVILMDISLPGMSGTDCVRTIRDRMPALPIVMLTVHQSNDRIFEAICSGATGYLLKSASADEIFQALEQVLAGGAPIDAQIARRVLHMFAGMAVPRSDYGLTEREREILMLLVEGRTNHQIARHLGLSPHTIDSHIRNVYAKLHVNRRSIAVAKALKERLL